jgi:eukaryotic-like serine/threonine-protein kinase
VQALERTLVWVDRKGTVFPLLAPTRPYMDPRLSRNGQQMVVEIYEKTKGDVWVYELARGTLTRLTFEGFENETALWTPNGSRIVFTSSRGGTPMGIFSKPVERSGDEEQLVRSQHHEHLGSISPDGRWLALTDYDPINGGDIWMMPFAGDHKPRPFLQTPFNEWGPVFSPDGRWLAYVSNESGRDEIYVQAFPGPGRKWQISTEGGTEPVWARTASELFYRDGDKMMAVTVATAPDLSAGKPRLLFEGRFVRGLTLGHTNYDVSPDGQRFLMIKDAAQQAAPLQVNVVLNWFDELKRRVPVGMK